MAKMSLRTRAWTSLGVLAVALGLMLFLSAGTLHYWKGWLFLVVFMGPTIITTAHLLKEDSALAERRMSSPATETRAGQKLVQAFNLVFFLALFVVPGLDRRFGWSHLPAGIAVAGAVMVLAAYWGLFKVMQANSFASSTVKLADGQTLVSTGPYGLVRHPMYSAGLLLIFAMPLTLGSLWGLVPAMALLAGIVIRLLDEEKFLDGNLPGYAEYRARTRFRLVPGIF
ncbi:isoprenylcysteine carboxylmethyltransferase family protein [soil metagenome]